MTAGELRNSGCWTEFCEIYQVNKFSFTTEPLEEWEPEDGKIRGKDTFSITMDEAELWRLNE